MPKEFKYKGSVHTVVPLIAAEGKLPTEIKVFPLGHWVTEPYGEMEITDEILGSMVKNFDDAVRGQDELPVDVDHDGGKAAGWFKKLIHKAGDGLYAVVEWTTYGQDLLNNKLYKLFSPEWSFAYRDPLTSTPYGPALIAGSLTNRPLFKQLPKLIANDGSKQPQNRDLTNPKTIMLYFNEDMDIAEILKKPKADRTPEEVKHLEENKSSLTPEQTTQLESENKPEPTPAPTPEPTPAPEPTPEPTPAPTPDDANTASEAKKAKEKAEADLKKANEEIARYKAAERRAATEKEMDKYWANEKGGKILPKDKDEVLDLVLSFNETQKTSFIKILDALPEVKVAGEVGTGENSHLTASQKFFKLVDEEVEKAKKAGEPISELQAQRKVRTENAELWTAYEKEEKGGK